MDTIKMILAVVGAVTCLVVAGLGTLWAFLKFEKWIKARVQSVGRQLAAVK